MTSPQLRARPLGDSAVTISFGAERSEEVLRRVHAAAHSVRAGNLSHVQDVVPAYLALTVFYDSLSTSYHEIAERLLDICSRARDHHVTKATPREHRIPVKYDGPDLEAVASATGFAAEEVIARHLARAYKVDLLGFVPGFAYLSELDSSLQLPRRAQPRPRVAAGSVAIAGAQTAVYPLDTPGGWHLLGSTTTAMFDPTRDPPALLSPGDVVRFERVS